MKEEQNIALENLLEIYFLLVQVGQRQNTSNVAH